jgi:hypothetical protein
MRFFLPAEAEVRLVCTSAVTLPSIVNLKGVFQWVLLILIWQEHFETSPRITAARAGSIAAFPVCLEFVMAFFRTSGASTLDPQ